MIRRPKTNKDIALQSHNILQMFAWWGLGWAFLAPTIKLSVKFCVFVEQYFPSLRHFPFKLGNFTIVKCSFQPSQWIFTH